MGKNREDVAVSLFNTRTAIQKVRDSKALVPDVLAFICFWNNIPYISIQQITVKLINVSYVGTNTGLFFRTYSGTAMAER